MNHTLILSYDDRKHPINLHFQNSQEVIFYKYFTLIYTQIYLIKQTLFYVNIIYFYFKIITFIGREILIHYY